MLAIPATMLAFLGLAAFLALYVGLTGGSIVGASNIQIKGTTSPQGTASTSSLQTLSTTATGAAQESLTHGTASGQVDLIVAQDRTLAASTPETLDLNSGALLDIFGAAAAFAHLKYIAIYILPGTGDVSGLTLAGGASNPFIGYGIGSGTGGSVTVYPNGPGFQNGEPAVGIACGSTACNIKITNNSSTKSVTYRIVFGGTST